VIEAAHAAWRRTASAYTDALGVAPLRRGNRPALPRTSTPSPSTRATSSSRGIVGRFSARLSRRLRAGRPGRAGDARLPRYRNILAALGLEPVLIEVGENAHYQPNPELLAEAATSPG